MKTHLEYGTMALAILLVLSLIVCGGLSVPARAANLVQNPGFETGSLSPWGKWNDVAVVSNDQRSGSYCLRVGNAPASSEQVVGGLTPNTTYTLSGWAKMSPSASGDIHIGVKEYGGSQLIQTISSTSYTQKSIDFTMGASNTQATIFCYRETGTGYAYCDDFNVDLSAPPPTDTPVPPTNTPLPAGTYYVDCSAGTDGDGSQSSPWNNLDKVNNTTFAAGSSILFKRGTTCAGTLWPKGSGSAGNPNVIDAYGTGAQPHIQATCADDGVYLYNQEYWEIRNLEVSNDCGTVSNNRRGIHIQLEDYGTGTYYRVLNNTVHDVAGDPNSDSPKDTGGIIFRVTGSSVQTKFSDVVVEGNTIYTTDRSGINMSSAWWCRAAANCSSGQAYYTWDPFTIRNNTLYDIGGDGIVLQYASGSLVEYNVLHDAQARSNRCNAGIWPWNADDVTFQYNEVYLVRLTNSTCDGQGFDIDYGTARTTTQYNYSHDNEGGFLLVCGPSTNGTLDAVARYNISQNDKKHVFHISGKAVTNAKVYNNTVYVPSGNNATIVEEGDWNGYPTSLYFYNNIFYILGNGGYSLSSGNISFDYNIFYGNHPASEPNDPHKITDDPMLVDPGSGGTGLGSVDGYKLQAGSPAIGAGKIVANNGGKDYWGNPVPSDSAPDIGAHQYSGSSGPTPTPSPTPEPTIPQTNWTLVYVDSEEMVGEDGAAVNAFDGDTMSIWHTEWQASQPPHPHEIQIDLGATYNLSAFRYLPRQFDNLNGNIGQYEFYVSTSTSDWGTPVATGTFADTGSEKTVNFASKTGRYIRLVALTEAGGRGPWTSVAEINLHGTSGPSPTDTPVPPTDTPVPPTDTPVPPTDTPVPPTDTPIPPTDTPTPGGWVELTYDDFESGWGSYTDGGGDCRRYTGGTYAHQGSAAADIQDNSGTSSSFYHTNPIDVYSPGYTQIKVEFWFEAVSMESGEDFWVQYYDGSTWHTVASYARGTDFSNGQFYSKEVLIDEASYTFPTDMKIRFMCDASGNKDDVYIDEIRVSAQ